MISESKTCIRTDFLAVPFAAIHPPDHRSLRNVSDTSPDSSTQSSFLLKHEFAIRRFHSLTGIVPLGLYMCVHLATNAGLLNGAETFQRSVFIIHSPGKLLPLIEWTLIFLPLIFHAGLGIWIAKSGKSNSSQYQFTSNRRYSVQRWTGFAALIYLFLHILHLHGWFHADWWLGMIRGAGFGQFAPYNAGSSLVIAMQAWGIVWPIIYLVGVLSCVYHFANGLWTAGITWGLWVSPEGQKRASKVCGAIGILLTIISLSAWFAAISPNAEQVEKYREAENRMYEAAVEAGFVDANPEKRSEPVAEDGQENESDED